MFKVSTSTLQQWKSKLKGTGTLAAQKRKSTWRKIDPLKLSEYVEKNPDAYAHADLSRIIQDVADVFFLVIDMERFGSSVASELYHMKYEVLVVDEHEDNVAPYFGQVASAVIGNTADEAVLRSLGVQCLDCVVAGIGEATVNSIWMLMFFKKLGNIYSL